MVRCDVEQGPGHSWPLLVRNEYRGMITLRALICLCCSWELISIGLHEDKVKLRVCLLTKQALIARVPHGKLRHASLYHLKIVTVLLREHGNI